MVSVLYSAMLHVAADRLNHQTCIPMKLECFFLFFWPGNSIMLFNSVQLIERSQKENHQQVEELMQLRSRTRMAEEKDMRNDGMERKDIEEDTTCTGSITFNTRRRHPW